MPVFTYIGTIVAASAFGIGVAATLGVSAAFVGAVVATGLAYITSRIINGNENKGNNSAGGAQSGGRIQVAPATNNKIPVIYGNAYVNGMITDARLITLEQKINDKMFYCLVLGETTNTVGSTYGVESVYWNDLRLTPLNATSNAHIVKDGRKVVDGDVFTAGAFVVDKTYVITKLGTTTQAQWNTIAGTAARIYGVGSIFQAATTGASSGTGQAQIEDFVDDNFIVGTNQYVELRVYAGGSTAADQIYPAQSTGNTANAYNFWGSGGTLYPNGDGSWTSANEMKGLVFAIVSVRYDNTKGFTSLPNVTFQIANNVVNPADVWLDYMTAERYGAGIDVSYIDETARLAWYNFCEEDISYTSANLDPQGGAGTTNQATSRYSINGIIDTSNQVKTNIDTILQNGGAWMSYNVDTGLWSPVIKKAVNAGIPGESPTYFTASRSTNQLIVTTFPGGRIEAGQLLYDSTDTLIGTILSQTAPTAGQTAGQIGTYTTSSSGTITTTTFYTLPASALEFSDDNIISGISISSTRLDDLYNEVEVEFYNKYNKDQKAYFRNYLDALDRNPNEPDNQLRMSLDLCNNSMQADILGQMELRQSRDDLVIEFTANHYGIQTQAGDVISITSELYDWAPKYFRAMRVKEQETEDGGLVAQIQALEYNPDSFTVEPITEFSTAANIGIGVYGSSPNLPLPPSVVIAAVDANAAIPNFQLQVAIPATGGPFDEIELYYTEGWDEHGINGKIVEGQVAVTAAAGTGSTATLTFTAPSPSFTPYDVGQVVTIAGMTPGGYNGVKTITAATASTISYVSTTTGAMTVAGTITNAAGSGLGLLTVTATTYGNINAGDRIDLPSDIYIVSQITNTVGPKTFSSGGVPGSNPSTSRLLTLTDVTGLIVGNTLTGTGIENGSFILEINPTGSPANTVRIEDAVTVQAAGTYAVTGGLGTYIVDTSVMASNVSSPAVNLFDFPEEDNYKLLKKLTPEGNNATFTNSEIVTDVVTNVPANSSTYRRWFVIARMGIKKRFGAFSVPGDVDFEEGRFPYEPNPVASGALSDLTDVSITSANEGQTLYYDATVSKWKNNSILEVDDTATRGGIVVGEGITQPMITFTPQADGVNAMYGIRGKSAETDPWFVGAGSTGIDSGYLEIATGDNTGDPFGDASPIYVRQYDGYAGSPAAGVPWYGGTGTVVHELTLLDEDGDTIIPNNLTVDNVLYVDAANNRVGIFKSVPDVTLDVNGAAGISGNLNVDSNTLLVDATNHRVGIKNGSPSVELDVTGATKISSNLTVDTNTLFVDATNHRVGIKNTSPTVELDVTGATKISSNLTVASSTLFVNASTNRVGVNVASPNFALDVGGAAYFSDNVTVIKDLGVGVNGGNAVLFVQDSTNRVGINNNTPTVELDVNGTANIETNLTVPSITTLTGDDLTITAFAGRDLTISTTTATDPVTIVRNLATTSDSIRTLTLRANSTGTPVINFGNFLEFETESTPGTFVRSGYLNNKSTGDNAGVLDEFNMSFGVMSAGTSTERMVLDNLGNLQIDGDITVSGGDITLNGSTSGSVKLSAPAVAGTQAYILPTADGTNGYILSTDGSGTLSWIGVSNATTTFNADVEFNANTHHKMNLDLGFSAPGGNTRMYSEAWAITSASFPTPLLTTIDFFELADYRSARYYMTIQQGAKREMVDVYVVHDGTNVNIIEFNSHPIGGTISRVIGAVIVSTQVQLNITIAADTELTYKTELTWVSP